MTDLSLFHQQIHKITEVSNVYRYLVSSREMCETSLASSLLFDFMDGMEDHLEQVDQAISKRLLTDPDPRTQNQARKFIAESAFLKKLFREYVASWTRKKARKLILKDHGKFLADTEEMINLVLDRLQRETEFLYPLWLRESA